LASRLPRGSKTSTRADWVPWSMARIFVPGIGGYLLWNVPIAQR
jgi:hypothetical protein